jgi:hypothetical protein
MLSAAIGNANAARKELNKLTVQLWGSAAFHQAQPTSGETPALANSPFSVETPFSARAERAVSSEMRAGWRSSMGSSAITWNCESGQFNEHAQEVLVTISTR